MRIFVACTGQDLLVAQRLASADDRILTLPSALGAESNGDRRVCVAPALVEAEERQLHSRLLEAIARLHPPFNTYVKSYINDFYLYFLRDLFQIVVALQRAQTSTAITEFVLFGPHGPPAVPLFLSQSLELPRGSRTVRAGALIHWIGRFTWRVPVRVHRTRHDHFGRPWVRGWILRVASGLFATKYALRVVGGHLKWGSGSAERGSRGVAGMAALVRTERQAELVRHIASDLPLAYLVVPAFTHGSVRSDEAIRSMLPDAAQLPTRDMLWALWRAWRTGERPSIEGTYELVDPWGRLLRDVAIAMGVEIRRFPLLLTTHHFITQLLERFKNISSLLTFEVHGREAGLIWASAHAAGVPVAAIQTVVVQGSPLPVFPFADLFCSVSSPASRLLATVGTVSCGEVVYGGPLSLARTPGGGATVAPRSIIYFSQPFDFGTSERIIEDLVALDEELASGKALKVKLHPRDSLRNYSRRTRQLLAGRVVSTRLEDLPRSSTLVVARTSSVLGEALLQDVTCCAVPWGELDRRVVVDYLSEGEHVCWTSEALAERVRAWFAGELDNDHAGSPHENISLQWLSDRLGQRA